MAGRTTTCLTTEAGKIYDLPRVGLSTKFVQVHLLEKGLEILAFAHGQEHHADILRDTLAREGINYTEIFGTRGLQPEKQGTGYRLRGTGRGTIQDHTLEAYDPLSGDFGTAPHRESLRTLIRSLGPEWDANIHHEQEDDYEE